MSPTPAGLEAYRSLRAELESNVLALASSLDGRRFTLQAPVPDLPVQLGG